MARTYGQYCGVTTALELVGERWALLIVRDLLVGPRRYTDLKQGLPRIPTNILSTRLKELQQAGVVRRAHLAHCGLVYELTEFGRGLEDVVLGLGRWGFRALGSPEPGEVVTQDSLTMALRTAFRADAAAGLPDTCYEVRLGPVALAVVVEPAALRIRPLGSTRPVDADRATLPPPDLVFAIGPELRALIAGELSPADAVAGGVVEVLAGPASLLDRFATTFHLPAEPGPEVPELLPTLA